MRSGELDIKALLNCRRQYLDVNSHNPHTWIVPSGWHSDWDAEWELDRLREFAVELLERTTQFTVALDPFDEGYFKVDVSRGTRKVGEVLLSHTPGDRSAAVYLLFFGQEGRIEALTYSVKQAVEWLEASKDEAWQEVNEAEGIP